MLRVLCFLASVASRLGWDNGVLSRFRYGEKKEIRMTTIS